MKRHCLACGAWIPEQYSKCLQCGKEKVSLCSCRQEYIVTEMAATGHVYTRPANEDELFSLEFHRFRHSWDGDVALPKAFSCRPGTLEAVGKMSEVLPAFDELEMQ